MMYVLSGKGSVAGADLATCIVRRCQQRGVLWDSDLPEYALDFATQLPSVSKSIREGNTGPLVAMLNERLRRAEQHHDVWMPLCLTAHKLLPQLHTRMRCINLWDLIRERLRAVEGPIAFLGTLESLPEDDNRFVTLPDHVDRMGDLITSIKRGYAALGGNYAAHPQRLLRTAVDAFRDRGAKTFLLACTDVHACKSMLTDMGVAETNIVDIIEISAEAVIECAGREYTTAFFDAASDARTHLRYKYLARSDSLRTDDKTRYLREILSELPQVPADQVNILDIGGSSSGHSDWLAERLQPHQCHITLQDISEASLEAAKANRTLPENVTTSYVFGQIEEFDSTEKYDFVLCLGVLLFVSADERFVATVSNVANLMNRGALLVTRDCLTHEADKLYMAFGGVIRNRSLYDAAFEQAGLVVEARNEFRIDTPIPRDIVTTVWKKAD